MFWGALQGAQNGILMIWGAGYKAQSSVRALRFFFDICFGPWKSSVGPCGLAQLISDRQKKVLTSFRLPKTAENT